MNVENRIEAAQFPGKEYISGIFLAVQFIDLLSHWLCHSGLSFERSIRTGINLQIKTILIVFMGSHFLIETVKHTDSSFSIIICDEMACLCFERILLFKVLHYLFSYLLGLLLIGQPF
jgi:hypothetical protein